MAAIAVAACAGAPPVPSVRAAVPSTSPADPTASSRPAVTASPGPYDGLTVVDVDADNAVLLGRDVGYLGVTTKFVWAATSKGLVRLDPRTLETKTVDDVGRFGLAATPDSVWVSDFSGGVVSRFQPAKGVETASVEVPDNPNAIAALDDSVWIAQHRGGSVTRLDRRSGKVTAVTEVGPAGAAGPQGVAADTSGVWVGIPNSQSVVRIDPATNAVVATITTKTSPCGGLALAPDAVWVSSCFDDHFAVRIDPRTNRLVAEIDIGGFNGGPILVDGYPWFPVYNQLVRVDPATNRVDRIVRFAKSAEFAAFGSVVGFDSVWIGGHGRIARIPVAALRD
jgi:YVTN family beta-propeller protein